MQRLRFIIYLFSFCILLFCSCGGKSDEDSTKGSSMDNSDDYYFHLNDTTSKPSRVYSDTCKINNEIYTYEIHRSSCDTLPVVKDLDGRMFYDNSIDLFIYKGIKKSKSSPLLEKHFTKNGLKSYENKYSSKNVTDLALIDFDYNKNKIDDHSSFNFVIYFGNITDTGFGDEYGEMLYGIRITLEGDLQITSLKPDDFKGDSMPTIEE